MSAKEEVKTKQEDTNLQFIVLLNLIIEKIEFLEEHGYIYGSIKSFLNNGKKKFEDFISKVFSYQDKVEGQSALDASTKILIMQQRVEKALLNEYMITPTERRRRAKMILKKTYLEQYKQMGLQKSLPANVLNEMRRKSIEQTLEDMRYYNLFNF